MYSIRYEVIVNKDGSVILLVKWSLCNGSPQPTLIITTVDGVFGLIF